MEFEKHSISYFMALENLQIFEFTQEESARSRPPSNQQEKSQSVAKFCWNALSAEYDEKDNAKMVEMVNVNEP